LACISCQLLLCLNSEEGKGVRLELATGGIDGKTEKLLTDKKN
jgi:hypothetical protein